MKRDALWTVSFNRLLNPRATAVASRIASSIARLARRAVSFIPLLGVGAAALLLALASCQLPGLLSGRKETPLPTISPAAGNYSSDLTGSSAVTITDTTSGATICYTTDGSAPTTSSTVYAGSISVTGNGTTPGNSGDSDCQGGRGAGGAESWETAVRAVRGLP